MKIKVLFILVILGLAKNTFAQSNVDSAKSEDVKKHIIRLYCGPPTSNPTNKALILINDTPSKY